MGLFDGLLGSAAGIGQQAAQQQGSLAAMLYGHSIGSLLGAAQDQQFAQQYINQPTRKHVDSVDVTPRERSRNQINGAVDAVKRAQENG